MTCNIYNTDTIVNFYDILETLENQFGHSITISKDIALENSVIYNCTECCLEFEILFKNFELNQCYDNFYVKRKSDIGWRSTKTFGIETCEEVKMEEALK